ncbi:MAG: hypothetical protein KF708_14830 [Pirellulales bacterium]|nr:hypothetical protein [Pirellulales bacterium]
MKNFLWLATLASALYCSRGVAQVSVDVPGGPSVDVGGGQVTVDPNANVNTPDVQVDTPNADVNVPDANVNVAPNATVAPNVNVNPPAASGNVQADVNAGVNADRDRADNRWRYRYHNGRWWYWQPNNSWVYWGGDRWNNYVAGQPFYGGPARRFNYYRGYNDGYYGNRYYDGYDGYYGDRYYDGYRGNRPYNYNNRGYYGRPGVNVGPGIRFNF